MRTHKKVMHLAECEVPRPEVEMTRLNHLAHEDIISKVRHALRSSVRIRAV